MTDDLGDKIMFLLQQLLNPRIMSGFLSAFLASLAGMAAMTGATSTMSAFHEPGFYYRHGFSMIFLCESLTLQRILGTAMVIAGLTLIARAHYVTSKV